MKITLLILTIFSSVLNLDLGQKTNAVFVKTKIRTAEKFAIKVQIKGFKNGKGKAYIALLDKNEKMIKGIIEPIDKLQVTATFGDLEPGKYAIKVFHDENNNGKLDTGMFGIPKEKWGVSNNVKVFVSPPKIEDLLFDLNSNKTISIDLK